MGILTGVRVAELGIWAAGPAAGGILADWGAEVVKIEPPAGDPMRRLFGAMSGSREERCPPFELYNRGKRSVAVDVNHEDGRALIERIVASADVFLTNMRPAFLRRVGLDHAVLLPKYPRLVYASLTGYGLDGPDRDAPGYDVAAFYARAGVANRSTPPGQAPGAMPGAMGDTVTGITTVAGILAALVCRDRTGSGQLVATSLLRTGTYCIGTDVSTRIGLDRLAAPVDRTAARNALLNCYAAGDGGWFWLMGAEAERHWPNLLEAVEDPRLRADRFATSRDRRRNAEELVAILDENFATQSRDEWVRRFTEHDVWWTPVNSVDDLLTDPQVVAAGTFVDARDSAGADTTVLATPVDFGTEGLGPLPGPPAVGSDTDAVLRDLGVDEAELRRLRAEGVLAVVPGERG